MGSSSNAFQYTGRENDETGLYYYRTRYYSPTHSRFTSEDRIEFYSGDVNLYAYVRNSPLRFRDPTGEAILPLMLAGAIIGSTLNAGAVIVAASLEGRPIDWGDVGAAAISGAIAGGIGALAGPAGGTLARALGSRSTSLLAKGITALNSAGVGALGQLTNNLLAGRKPTANLGRAALFSGLGGYYASFIPTRVANTLRQAYHFAPNFNTLAIQGSSQSTGITAGLALSNSIGAASNF